MIACVSSKDVLNTLSKTKQPKEKGGKYWKTILRDCLLLSSVPFKPQNEYPNFYL